ncbi:MAG: helix-turn-helix transcriptional regulator [Bacteroidales bacterium]|nr:helix-turn-helix transcriptional regulator [Bacteroidales bacterium]
MKSKVNEEIQKQFLIELGKKIKIIRKEKKMTQQDVAIRLNGDKQKISRIERGMYDFKISSLLIIAYGLDIEVDELLKIKNIEKFKNLIWENH